MRDEDMKAAVLRGLLVAVVSELQVAQRDCKSLEDAKARMESIIQVVRERL